MKRLIPVTVLMACLLLAGTSLTCKNVVRSLADFQLGDDNPVCLDDQQQFKAMAIDTGTHDSTCIVYGKVFVDGATQEGAICSLVYASHVRTCLTDGNGRYAFWCQACYIGWYRIKACYQERCNRKADCYGKDHEFFWAAHMDPVEMDLCIGSGGLCPYPKCD